MEQSSGLVQMGWQRHEGQEARVRQGSQEPVLGAPQASKLHLNNCLFGAPRCLLSWGFGAVPCTGMPIKQTELLNEDRHVGFTVVHKSAATIYIVWNIVPS